MWNAAREYLKKNGAIPAAEAGQAETVDALAGLAEEQQEGANAGPTEGQSEAAQWTSV
jgi:hypothetical protein